MEDPDIPIVGQAATIIAWYPTAIVHCRCQDGTGAMSVIITTGFGNHSACGHCGKLYYIKGMMPDNKGGLSLLVDFVVPIPQGMVS